MLKELWISRNRKQMDFPSQKRTLINLTKASTIHFGKHLELLLPVCGFLCAGVNVFPCLCVRSFLSKHLAKVQPGLKPEAQADKQKSARRSGDEEEDRRKETTCFSCSWIIWGGPCLLSCFLFSQNSPQIPDVHVIRFCAALKKEFPLCMF